MLLLVKTQKKHPRKIQPKVPDLPLPPHIILQYINLLKWCLLHEFPNAYSNSEGSNILLLHILIGKQVVPYCKRQKDTV